MTLASKVIRPKKPPKFVILSPSAFADTWDDKPTTEVAVGIRTISQHEIDVAQREADKEALGFYATLRETPLPLDPDSVIRVYNDALVMNAVAKCACDPNDVTKPYREFLDDRVRQIFTPDGAARIWDELVLLSKGSGVHRPQSDDDDVRLLARRLAGGAELDAEARKLCAYLLEKVSDGEDLEVEAPDGDEDRDDVYVTKAG